MLQRIRDSGRWIAIILLGLIAVSFIFFGIDFGLMGTSGFAAKVNGENISLTEFDRELQSRQNEFQRLYRTELTEEMRRELRASVIEDLVQREALRQRIVDQGYRVSNERLAAAIRDTPAFQINGEFSFEVYQGMLANQGMSPEAFEAMQREALEITDFQVGIAESTFLTPAEFRRYIELYNQRREIAYAIFDPESFAETVTIDDAQIAAHYENNQANYQTPETVDLEYVELSLADIAATVEVTDEDVLAAYDQERDRFTVAEERYARHILIEIEGGDEQAARATAESVVSRLRGGEDFAAVAAEVSDDAGTKAQGGDLGWIGRGMLVGPFEDALFAMQVGEISDPVRSDFGFHVIRLDDVRAGEEQSFEDVREGLAAELRTRRAEDQFFDRANRLEELAFNAYNELATVATEVGLPLKTLTGFSRTGEPPEFSNNAAVVQAAFAEEIVDSGRNSELVQLAEDHVLVLRVTTHHLPMTRPLDEVREQIREELMRERAEQLASEAGEAFLAAVEQGGDPVELAATHGGTWVPAAWVERTDATVPTEVLAAAFNLPKTAPGTVQREGVALASGAYGVVVVSGVEAGEPSSLPQAERDQRQRQLADQSARAELVSYIDNVRRSASVRVPPEVLEPPIY